MSSAKGNTARKRPQKHQNRTAFKNDLHDTSKHTKLLNSLEIVGVCSRCKSILEWKIKYKKYKALTAPRKCVSCEQKSVKSAYHVLCNKCAREKNVCSKCCQPAEKDEIQTVSSCKEEDILLLVQDLPERKRRTVLRNIRKQQNGELKATQEAKTYIENVISKMGNIDLEDDDSFFNEDFSDSISGSEDDN